MMNTIAMLNTKANELGKQLEDLHKPFAGAFDDEEHYLVEQERNTNHAQDNNF